MSGGFEWVARKPTRAGVYGVRGFEFGVPKELQFEAVVAVRRYEDELVCNLHLSTSDSDLEDWQPLAELSDRFEWCEFAPASEAREVTERDVERALTAAMARARIEGVGLCSPKWDSSFPTRGMWRAALESFATGEQP